MRDRTGAIFFIMVSNVMNSVFSNLTTIEQEIPVFLRERGSKSYYVSAYFVSKVLSDFLPQTIFPAVFGVIAYWVVGLNADFWRFMAFLLILIVVGHTGQSLGRF